MLSMNMRLAQQIPVQRQSHRTVHYKLQKLRKPRPLGPIRSYDCQQDPRGRAELFQNRRNQRIGRKGICLPPIPRLEKSICPQSIGIVRLRTGRLTPATFSEAAETQTVSGSTRNPESDLDERENLPTQCCAP